MIQVNACINDLIKRVRRHEVHGEGVSLQVRHALTPSRVSQPCWDGTQLRDI